MILERPANVAAADSADCLDFVAERSVRNPHFRERCHLLGISASKGAKLGGPPAVEVDGGFVAALACLPRQMTS